MQTAEVAWEHLTIAIVGGDEREGEIARLAGETGAEVRGYGFPWPGEGISGVARAQSPADAVRDARYLIFPIPAPHPDGRLFAEGVEEPIYPSEELLAGLAPDAHIFGWTDAPVRALAEKLAIQLHDYQVDEELMQLRAPAICEGALKLAIENTVRTLHASQVVVTGFGNIGRQMTQTLLALRADVTVVARNARQRAAAYALGAHSEPLDKLPEIAPNLVAVFSTAPAQIVDRNVMERLPADALVMDLAATPGSVDRALATDLGINLIWARGLGRRAPVTVGATQWAGIKRRIETAETQRARSG